MKKQSKNKIVNLPLKFNVGTLKYEPDIVKIKIKGDKWKNKLTAEQYHILREGGTESPGSGKLLHNKQEGKYVCGACGNVLFESKTKFDSETGWPSFHNVKKGSVKLKKDFSLLIPRIEVVCLKCGSHLGHVFKHPKSKDCPTGKRYCINSLALDFKKK